MSDVDKLTEEERQQMRDLVLAVSGTGQEAGPGYVVKMKSGAYGRTYHRDQRVNGKQVVHSGGKKYLCDPAGLTGCGFID